jgi:SAM-dependent methyltransferase
MSYFKRCGEVKDSKFSERRVADVWDGFWKGQDSGLNPDPYANYLWEDHVYWFKKCLGSISRKRVLEVGVGFGKLLSMLAGSGATVSGIDISQTAIEEARELFVSRKLKGDLRVASALSLPYEAESFDLVYALGLIEHFEDDCDKRKIIKECYRVTKKNGVLLLTVPKKLSVYTPKRALKKVLGTWQFGYEEEFSAREVVSLITSTVDVEVRLIFPIDIYPPPFNLFPSTLPRRVIDKYLMVPLCVWLGHHFTSLALKVSHLVGVAVTPGSASDCKKHVPRQQSLGARQAG